MTNDSWRLPPGYPTQLPDEDLAAALAEATNERHYPGFDEFHRLLPELKLALVAMGLQEQSRRETAELRASAGQTLNVAKLSLAVALIAVVISVLLALLD